MKHPEKEQNCWAAMESGGGGYVSLNITRRRRKELSLVWDAKNMNLGVKIKKSVNVYKNI